VNGHLRLGKAPKGDVTRRGKELFRGVSRSDLRLQPKDWTRPAKKRGKEGNLCGAGWMRSRGR